VGTRDLERIFRDEWPRVLAALARRLGDLQLAEDATQDAFVAAAERWPVDGVPEVPAAWLAVTARRRAIDRLRRQRLDERSGRELGMMAALERQDDDETARLAEAAAELPDDRLRLLCACCHPALAPEARVALTLRLVAGLTTEEIAGAFLVPVPTMAQRLSRAKAKIRTARIPLEVPGREALPDRLADVTAVVYLVFNEGYAAHSGDALVRRDLCAEAIRLARLLRVLVPDDAEVAGLLALLLLHDARSAARTAPDGTAVPLDHQDRGAWDREAVSEGAAALEDAVRLGPPGPFQIQAAIAAEHLRPDEPADVDWGLIARLYERLAAIAPSPVVEANRAVAVGRASGAAAGLAILRPVIASGRLDDYAPLHAARADLLEASGDMAGAAAAWRRAIAASDNTSVRAHLRERLRATGEG
jgi:RNA polymerase sigma-70 factor, ECF subfamily